MVLVTDGPEEALMTLNLKMATLGHCAAALGLAAIALTARIRMPAWPP